MKMLAEKLPESFDLKSINKYMPTAVNLLLLLACSYTLAQLTWLLIPADNNTTVIPVHQSVKTGTTQQSAMQQKIQAIPDAHLFG